VQRDIIRQLFPGKMTENREEYNKRKLAPFDTYNKIVLDSLARFNSWAKPGEPTFVYAHILMPHFPYFYDSAGRSYPDKAIYGDSMINSRERFGNYIAYTDKKIMALVNSLFSQKAPGDIFIIQSDHGVGELDRSRPKDSFRNILAFYFPDSNYKHLYPGMSNVNTFRIVFNKYFGQQLTLLRDSTSFVK
jgi:phosphoglycerol transferase MdoB-like AlkP superfamily enzyme